MRYTRWIALGIVASVVTATGVGALTGTSPTRTSVNLVAVVDELGNVLFGTKPGRVEVTNFPSSGGSEQVVTLLNAVTLAPTPCTGGPSIASCPGTFAVVPTAPFRNVALFGDARPGGNTDQVYVWCWFALDSFSGPDDQVVKAFAGSGPIGTSGISLWNTTPTPGPVPVVGPFFGCSVVNFTGTTQAVSLKARLAE